MRTNTLQELERIRASESAGTRVPFPKVKVARDPVSRKLTEAGGKRTTERRDAAAPVRLFAD